MSSESAVAAQGAINLFSSFTISDGLMICAVILAPLIAVQVDKYLEKKRNKKGRKLGIFKTLMATRGRALDPRHVEALNMIDLEFEGEKSVTDAWKAYLDHLVNMPKYPNTVSNESKDFLKTSMLDPWGNFSVLPLSWSLSSPRGKSLPLAENPNSCHSGKSGRRR